MDAEFSREAGHVLASPYFTQPPTDLTGAALRKWWDDRQAEKDALFEAVRTANSRAELDDKAKAIYDRAFDAVVNLMAQSDLYDRLHGADYAS